MTFGENPLFFNLLYKNVNFQEIIVYQWIEQILKSNVNRAYRQFLNPRSVVYVQEHPQIFISRTKANCLAPLLIQNVLVTRFPFL